MRDGEHKGKKVEVVPNECIRLKYGEEEGEHLTVSASHDAVVRFVEPQYNYLRYFDASTEQIIAVFLAAHILADLMDFGIPATELRNKITEGEMEAYQHHLGQIAMEGVSILEEAYDPGTPPPVPLELMPGDPIDAAIQSAHDEIEHGGLEWFLGEWAEGRDGTS